MSAVLPLLSVAALLTITILPPTNVPLSFTVVTSSSTPKLSTADRPNNSLLMISVTFISFFDVSRVIVGLP